jgi:hypothetical protein
VLPGRLPQNGRSAVHVTGVSGAALASALQQARRGSVSGEPLGELQWLGPDPTGEKPLMSIHEFDGRVPAISASAFIAPTAVIIGDVTIGADCYVGRGAILRGDCGSIVVGEATSVEEGVIVHARLQDRAVLGRGGTVGHGAMIHNATVCDGATITRPRSERSRERRCGIPRSCRQHNDEESHP